MSLIGSLTSGVTGLQTFSKDLEVIGNNISNVNTTAYKSSRLDFTESFSNTLRDSQPATANTSNVLAAQIGTGVRFSGVTTSFNQGALTSTGVATDLGISGEGYFIVRDPTSGSSLADSRSYATRDGNFRWDDGGYLVTAQGMRVVDATGADILQAAAPAPASIQSISINTSGQVIEFFTDGTNTTTGGGTPQTIGLATFKQQGALMNKGDGLFSYDVAGITTTLPALGNPGSPGYGTIEASTLEQSNVDLTSEFANMITAQRSFQANARVVTVSDSVLDDVVNLKRS